MEQERISFCKKPVLVCWLVQLFHPGNGDADELTFTYTPLSCFSKAVSGGFSAIWIFFSVRDAAFHPQVIELCEILNQNRLTAQIQLTVFMETAHRQMLIKMKHAGVNAVEFYKPDAGVDLRELISSGRKQESNTMDQVLEKLCPSLNYIQVDGGCETPVCGAYQNRMVLGGKRLHEVCHTRYHACCEFLLNAGGEAS